MQFCFRGYFLVLPQASVFVMPLEDVRHERKKQVEALAEDIFLSGFVELNDSCITFKTHVMHLLSNSLSVFRIAP